MSKVTFETELNDEALGALKSYLAKRNEQLDMRLSEQLEKLYAATVPAAVREYLGEKNGTPVRRSAARPRRAAPAAGCALPGFVDSKNEEKTERNAGYLVVSHSGGGMLRQGTRKGIRRTPANRGMRAHWVVKGLDISEDVCHGMCP